MAIRVLSAYDVPNREPSQGNIEMRSAFAYFVTLVVLGSAQAQNRYDAFTKKFASTPAQATVVSAGYVMIVATVGPIKAAMQLFGE